MIVFLSMLLIQQISLKRVADNAYKQYIKSRSLPSAESVKRVKELHLSGLPVHPILGKYLGFLCTSL